MAREVVARSLLLLQCRRLLSKSFSPTSAIRLYRDAANRDHGLMQGDTPPRPVKVFDPQFKYYKKHYYDREIDIDVEEQYEEDRGPPGRNPSNARRDRDARARRKIMDEELGREPCLLTWAAKDQIRYLHRMDPDEFSAERLSESFPISLIDIRRILRKRYVRTTSSAVIARHDRAVTARWAALKTGHDWRRFVSEEQRKQYLDGSLVMAHFSGNSAFPAPPPVKEFKPPEPVSGPFTALLKTYIEMQEDQKKAIEAEKAPAALLVLDSEKLPEVIQNHTISRELAPQRENTPDYRPFQAPRSRDTPLYGGIEFVETEENNEADPEDTPARIRRGRRSFKSVQLSEVKEDIIRSQGKEQPEAEEAYRKWFNQYGEQPGNVAERQERRKEVVKEFEDYGGSVRMYKSSGRNIHEVKEDKIVIPQDKKRAGALYKYGDSFYDEDGEFMYRVPV